MPEVLDRAKNFIASAGASFFRRPPRNPNQTSFIIIPESAQESTVKVDDERFDPVKSGIQEILDSANFGYRGYRTLLRDRFSFPLSAGDFRLVNQVNHFLPSVRNTGAELQIHLIKETGTNYKSSLGLVLPEMEIGRRRIKYTSLRISASAVDEIAFMGAIAPRAPYKEVHYQRMVRPKGNLLEVSTQDLLMDPKADPVLALQQIKRMVENLKQEFSQTEADLQQQILTSEERVLVQALSEKTQTIGEKFSLFGFIGNDKLQKLVLAICLPSNSGADLVWRDRNFLTELPGVEYYFMVPSTSSRWDELPSTFYAEGILNINGDRLPIILFEGEINYPSWIQARLFKRFLCSRAGLVDELGIPPISLAATP